MTPVFEIGGRWDGGEAEVLRAGADSATKPGLSPAQVEFDIGYGLVTHECTGLLTTYGHLGW